VQVNADGHGSDFAVAAILTGGADFTLDDLAAAGNIAAA
jgi:hypothetical protein